jgi:hypothetical protein
MMSEFKKDNKEDFTRLFNSFLKVHELEEMLVCRKLKISRTTFHRWLCGVSAPHPLGQDEVFQVLDELRDTPTKEV